jgi:hypothetical protein
MKNIEAGFPRQREKQNFWPFQTCGETGFSSAP